MEATFVPTTSAKQKLDMVQKKIPVMDTLIRETESHIKELQSLLRDQTAQREQLMDSIAPLEEELKLEADHDTPPSLHDATNDKNDSTATNGSTNGTRQANLKGTNVKIMLPPTVRIQSFESLALDSPQSPLPTAGLSPPPPKNRLFAGHTPSIAISVSPHGASEPTTPTAPSKPIVLVTKKDSPEEVELLPREEDDPYLDGPLTAQDEGFLEEVSEKLEAVKVGKKAVVREDSLSPEREAAHGERLDGVVLKPTWRVNFGAPLGNLRLKKKT